MHSAMKILFLTPWYPDDEVKNHGIFVQEQAQALAHDHEVVVISSKVNYKRFSFSSSLLVKSVNAKLLEYRLVVNKSLPIFNQLNYLWVSFRVSKKIANDFKPDVIHGNIGYPGGIWAWMLSKIVHAPFVVTEHNSNFSNNFRSWFHKKLTIFPLERANAVVAVSSHSAKQMQRFIDRKIDVIPNLIRTERFTVKPTNNQVVKFGFLGSLDSPNHAKGLPILLKVLSMINSPFFLVIGGGGRMMNSYKGLAFNLGLKDKCEFKGYVPYDKVPDFMNQLDFFVNVAKHESFGIAIIEAMASGLPVVCFDNGGPSDFVNDSNGLLIENQNQQKLQHAIEWMLANYNIYVPEKIQESVLNRFSSFSFVERLKEIYCSAIS
jgi:glycosyltransferase involved in cell wall biosynthesis